MVGKTLILRNITEQIRLQEYLSILATRDGLTNIYNRRYFLELVNIKLKQGRNKAQSLAIILFDIDFFKNINDTYGHEAGDVVLCKVAEACAASLRNMNIYARYGGEEFICMLPNISSKSAIKIAERIRSNIACIPLSFHGDAEKITASFGVSGTDLSVEAGLEELINMADKALYDAKRQGRNRTCIYEIGYGQLDFGEGLRSPTLTHCLSPIAHSLRLLRNLLLMRHSHYFFYKHRYISGLIL